MSISLILYLRFFFKNFCAPINAINSKLDSFGKTKSKVVKQLRMEQLRMGFYQDSQQIFFWNMRFYRFYYPRSGTPEVVVKGPSHPSKLRFFSFEVIYPLPSYFFRETKSISLIWFLTKPAAPSFHWRAINLEAVFIYCHGWSQLSRINNKNIALNLVSLFFWLRDFGKKKKT